MLMLSVLPLCGAEAGADDPALAPGTDIRVLSSEMYLSFMEEVGVKDAKYEAEALVRSCSTYFGYPAAVDPLQQDNCIDHIFVNDRVEVRLYNAVIDRGAEKASDHIPIYADIELK